MDPNTSFNSRSRRKILVAIALVAIAGIGILTTAYVVADRLTEPGDPVLGVTAIEVRDNSFSPDAVQVAAGSTMTWTWEGDHKHNIHGGGLDAPSQTEGTYTHTFDEPGTYDYECTLHFGMKGRVIVTEAEQGA